MVACIKPTLYFPRSPFSNSLCFPCFSLSNWTFYLCQFQKLTTILYVKLTLEKSKILQYPLESGNLQLEQKNEILYRSYVWANLSNLLTGIFLAHFPCTVGTLIFWHTKGVISTFHINFRNFSGKNIRKLGRFSVKTNEKIEIMINNIYLDTKGLKYYWEIVSQPGWLDLVLIRNC